MPDKVNHDPARWSRARRCVRFAAGLVLLLVAAGLIVGRRDPVMPRLPVGPLPAPGERVLVLAPHEDDETLGAGGFIQQALATGAAVRVVFVTYGDHNQLAFMAYRKQPVLTPRINRRMGEARRREALAATKKLGLSSNEVVFLGYPDLGLLPIWEQHWGAAEPFYSLLINARSVPYADARAAGRPFKGETVLHDLADVIRAFRPTRILVPHPADGHPDHRAVYLFCRAALWECAETVPAPELCAYPVHAGLWPVPKRLQPEEWLSVPPRLARGNWMVCPLPVAVVAAKAEALACYPSQMASARDWMLAFARRNELFETFPDLQLPWQAEPGPDAGAEWTPFHATAQTEAYEVSMLPTGHLAGVCYAQSAQGLVVDVALRPKWTQELGLSVFAFGYRSGTPFAAMPKIHVRWRPGVTRVQDQSTALDHAAVRVTEEGGRVRLVIPWELLGSPERVLAATRGWAGDLSVAETAWQVLRRTP